MPIPALQSPATAGLDAAQLKQIDRHFQGHIDRGTISGALTLVARKGAVAHMSPLGMADADRAKPTALDTIYRIYSMSKPITSVALMQQYERGLMQLDDPVHKYIPAWKDLRVFAGGNHPNYLTNAPERRMTVRDLLSHQSGLTYGFMERTNVDAAYRKLGVGGNGTLKEMADKLATLPLEFSPGSRWNYSVSTDICGHLVEIISGQPFDQYLQANVFDPLKMEDTSFWVPEAKLPRFAANYSTGASGLELMDDPQASTYAKSPSFLGGGGGLVSTAGDYYRFCQALLNGGQLDDARVLGRKTIDLMTANHLTSGGDLLSMATGGYSEAPYVGDGFGLGFSVALDPAKGQISGSPGEFAWGGAASTAFWIDPKEELVVVFMTQLMAMTPNNFRRELKALVYAALD